MRQPTLFEAASAAVVFAFAVLSLAAALAGAYAADGWTLGSAGFGWLVGASTVVVVWCISVEAPGLIHRYRRGGPE